MDYVYFHRFHVLIQSYAYTHVKAGLDVDPSHVNCSEGIEKSKNEIEQQRQYQQQEKDKRERIEKSLAIGNVHLRQQDLVGAMSSYEEGLKLDPTHTGKGKDTKLLSSYLDTEIQ